MKYLVLVVLYVLLVLFHAWHYTPPAVPKWPLLPWTPPPHSDGQACLQTSDCDAHHVCLQHTCFPQLLRGQDCYPATGDWTLTGHQGRIFASCQCKDHQLVTQKIPGGNCDSTVACRPGGTFNVHTHQCDCPHGYLAQPGYTCRKMTALQAMQHYDCGPDEIPADQASPADGFDPAYIQAHQHKKCFKRPCSFDALTGTPLKMARYNPKMGCDCDPTLGLFGVRIDATPYLNSPGYNACVSLFKHPATRAVHVSIAAYFYLMQRPPVVFSQYENLNWEEVIEPLQEQAKQGSLQISHEFPYDPMQAILRNGTGYTVRTRHFAYDTYYMTQRKEMWNMVENHSDHCRNISGHLSFLKNTQWLQYRSRYQTEQQRNWVWMLLYHFPACYVSRDDLEAPEQYRGRYVSNPFHLTLTPFPNDDRYNGLLMTYKNHRWHLDFAPPLDVDTYIQAANAQTVPIIEDDVIRGVVDNSLTEARLLHRQRTA